MLRSKPVIAVALCGQEREITNHSQGLRHLKGLGQEGRSPSSDALRRFEETGGSEVSSYKDFEKHQCTIEEREEYEPLVDRGMVVYAGVDYGKILERAEEEADAIVWDGGNNDTPFYCPDVHIVLFDAHRPGHELLYFPGETNLLMADIAVINKVDTAKPENTTASVETSRSMHQNRKSCWLNHPCL
jgi:hypothetical protein